MCVLSERVRGGGMGLTKQYVEMFFFAFNAYPLCIVYYWHIDFKCNTCYWYHISFIYFGSFYFQLSLTTTNIIPLVPVIDGEFITKHPRILLAEGNFKQCDIFIGNTADDGSLIVLRAYPEQIPKKNPYSDYDKFVDRIERFTYVDKTAVTVNAIEQQYIDWQLADNPSTNYFYNYMDLMTDEAFHCPAEHTARTYALNGNKVYRYYFNHMPARSVWPPVPSWWGIAHAEDIPFFFGWAFSDTFNWFQTPEEKTLALDMMRYFTNFAKTG